MSVGRTNYQDRWHCSSPRFHTRDSERMRNTERTAEVVRMRTTMIEGEPTDVSATNDQNPGEGKQTSKMG